ncbi:hypothetical protein ACFT5D_35250, partial [Streptomyces sp. NPDC057144]|uniref:hypothetical protein n=1 Tax=Streptomyces sp. NPDC057144 TaxID=3346034 RepID=UPI003633EA77
PGEPGPLTCGVDRTGYHWKFLLTRNFTLALLARNLTSEQHPVIRITGRPAIATPHIRKEFTRCCPGADCSDH